MTIYKTALIIPVRDSGLFSIMSNYFIINKLIKTLYPTLTSLPNYGKKYDKQSYWLVESKDRKPSDPVLIFLHGGGYFVQTMPSQIESLLSIYHLLEEPQKSKLSILVLDYKLACHGYKVPYQLTELIDTYTNLVKDGSKNILLMGDSAGGNLALIFLQSLKIDKLSLPYPSSVLLISPWVKLAPDNFQNTPGNSYYDNAAHDMLPFNSHSSELLESLLGDSRVYSLTISPGNCPYNETDWKDIPSLNHPGYSVFVITGEHECFRDDILEWANHSLQSPLTPQKGDSQGRFNPKIHQYIRDTPDTAYAEVLIEPCGVHDSVLYFENSIISILKNNPRLNAKSLDKVEYFGITKVVDFLNKTLSSEEKKGVKPLL
ncbi:hypothetical protein MGK_04302 [Candida albicans P57055]|nr:hypothetical protein MGK_04302 [Candida albicans P57055]